MKKERKYIYRNYAQKKMYENSCCSTFLCFFTTKNIRENQANPYRYSVSLAIFFRLFYMNTDPIYLLVNYKFERSIALHASLLIYRPHEINTTPKERRKR